ncbi:hypothetical protein ACWCOT_17565 [Nonomuraea bangladeshensis]
MITFVVRGCGPDPGEAAFGIRTAGARRPGHRRRRGLLGEPRVLVALAKAVKLFHNVHNDTNRIIRTIGERRPADRQEGAGGVRAGGRGGVPVVVVGVQLGQRREGERRPAS